MLLSYFVTLIHALITSFIAVIIPSAHWTPCIFSVQYASKLTKCSMCTNCHRSDALQIKLAFVHICVSKARHQMVKFSDEVSGKNTFKMASIETKIVLLQIFCQLISRYNTAIVTPTYGSDNSEHALYQDLNQGRIYEISVWGYSSSGLKILSWGSDSKSANTSYGDYNDYIRCDAFLLSMDEYIIGYEIHNGSGWYSAPYTMNSCKYPCFWNWQQFLRCAWICIFRRNCSRISI